MNNSKIIPLSIVTFLLGFGTLVSIAAKRAGIGNVDLKELVLLVAWYAFSGVLTILYSLEMRGGRRFLYGYIINVVFIISYNMFMWYIF